MKKGRRLGMNFTFNSILNTYSIVILILILVSSARQLDRDSFVNRFFNIILISTIIVLFFDILGRLDGTESPIMPVINVIGNFMLFSFNLVVPSLWLMYAHYQVYFDEARTMKLRLPLIILNLANFIMVIISQFNGWYYTIADGNIYQRGPLYFVTVIISSLLIVTTFLIVVFNRERIDRKRIFSLSSFCLPPLICMILQSVIYGYAFMLSGTVISLLVIYLNIQNQNIYTDYITSLNNRRGLERYLKEKVMHLRNNENFAGIMLDIDQFKSINDKYGHYTGDIALAETAILLNSLISGRDIVARYGGDEFFIIINNTDEVSLKAFVESIHKAFDERNKKQDNVVPLTVSIGYAIYTKNCGLTIAQFQDNLDKMMYSNKPCK